MQSPAVTQAPTLTPASASGSSAANATAPVPAADAPSAAGPALAPAPGNSSSNTTAVQIHLHITGSDVVPFTNATESAVLAALEQVGSRCLHMHCASRCCMSTGLLLHAD